MSLIQQLQKLKNNKNTSETRTYENKQHEVVSIL